MLSERSTQNAIAQCYKMTQLQNLHFVVDVDIVGFFNNIRGRGRRRRGRRGVAVTPGVNTGMPGTHILVPDAVGR